MTKLTIKVFAIIDTNVILSSIRKTRQEKSYDREVMQYVLDGNIIPVVDGRILEEYLDVLSRPCHNIAKEDIEAIITSIINKSIYVLNVEKTKTEIWDKGDIPFFEIVENTLDLDSRLVTHNLRDFVEKRYDRAGNVIDRKHGEKPANKRIVTPQEYIEHLNMLQEWIPTFQITAEILNEGFDITMRELLSGQKYKLTKDVIDVTTDGDNLSFVSVEDTLLSKNDLLDSLDEDDSKEER